MRAEYLGVLFILAFAVALVCVLGLVSVALRPSRPPRMERERSGDAPSGRLHVAFHRRAIVSAIVGTYAAFLYPWAATFRDSGLPGLVAIALFAVPLFVGLIYEWARDAHDG